MTSRCPHCGQATRDGSKFCARCGQPLPQADGSHNNLTRAPLQPGMLLKQGDYRILHALTRGGMGAVYLAQDRRAFDRHCVIKQMLDYYDPADPAERAKAEARFQEEGRTLASLSHPGVPRIYAFFREAGRFFIVMEHIQGRNLESFCSVSERPQGAIGYKPLPQEEIVRYGIQACRILEYLHAQPTPVVHQDIKPANLILEAQMGQVRLVDFGTARAQVPEGHEPGDGSGDSVYGTDGYAPPEQYRGKPEAKSDVYALAATMYHLLTDDDPRDHPFKWPRLGVLPRELAVPLEQALRNDPEKRSTATELRRSLEVLAEPSRTLEAFTFPGNVETRSVAALPALCDEHWDAARTFLYDGDFGRWLRDINRHDLVLAAERITRSFDNHDAGLEAFLREIDAGLRRPQVSVDPATVDLGGIARLSSIESRITLLNTARGYIEAKVTADKPWVAVLPKRIDLWAGIPADVRIAVHAADLPFRSQQQANIALALDDGSTLDVPLVAHVSLWREAWRLLHRALSAALPEAWRSIVAVWRSWGRVTRAVGRPFVRHGWLVWTLWFLLSAGLGAAAYFIPTAREFLRMAVGLQEGQTAEWIAGAIAVPPLGMATLYLSALILSLLGGGLLGACRGGFRSLFR